MRLPKLPKVGIKSPRRGLNHQVRKSCTTMVVFEQGQGICHRSASIQES